MQGECCPERDCLRRHIDWRFDNWTRSHLMRTFTQVVKTSVTVTKTSPLRTTLTQTTILHLQCSYGYFFGEREERGVGILFPLTSASESLSFFFFSLTFISNTCSMSCCIFLNFNSRSSFSASSCSRGLLLNETLQKIERGLKTSLTNLHKQNTAKNNDLPPKPWDINY